MIIIKVMLLITLEEIKLKKNKEMVTSGDQVGLLIDSLVTKWGHLFVNKFHKAKFC